MPNTLTCVYCGMAYPEGTPSHGAQVLTDHIKVCPKPPLRQAENLILELRHTLHNLEELRKSELILKSASVSIADKIAVITAMHVWRRYHNEIIF